MWNDISILEEKKKENVRHVAVANCRHCDDSPPKSVRNWLEVWLRRSGLRKINCAGEQYDAWGGEHRGKNEEKKHKWKKKQKSKILCVNTEIYEISREHCTYQCDEVKYQLFDVIHRPSSVNFINVKRTNFSYEHCFGSFFSSYMYIEKWHSYKKFVRKMLMKLTPSGIIKALYVKVMPNKKTRLQNKMSQKWRKYFNFYPFSAVLTITLSTYSLHLCGVKLLTFAIDTIELKCIEFPKQLHWFY